MSDKPIAGLVTALAIAPLCAFCILGPAAFASMFAWAVSWLGGFELWMTVLATVGAAALVYVVLRRRAGAPRNVTREKSG